MIETIISSKTRVKLLLKFFLNSKTQGYLRGLEEEFGESSNAIRLELNKFEKSGMLKSFVQGNKKFFQANVNHPLFNEIHNLIIKHIGFDQIIENVIEKLGDINQAYVLGDFAKGKDNPVIDLMLIGNINKIYLVELIEKAEKIIDRRIRYIIYDRLESVDWNLVEIDSLLLWNKQD